MDKRTLELKNIQTNHKLEDASYTVIDAIRTPSGVLQGISLEESKRIFTYLGVEYFLNGTRLTSADGRIVIDSYDSHIQKNGKIFIRSTTGEFFKLTHKAKIFQTKRYALYGSNDPYESSLCKDNVPYIPQEGGSVFVDSRGQVYLFEDNKYFLCSDAGEVLEEVSTTINKYETEINYPSIDFEKMKDAIKARLEEATFSYTKKWGDKYSELIYPVGGVSGNGGGAISVAQYTQKQEEKTLSIIEDITIEISNIIKKPISKKGMIFFEIHVNTKKNMYSVSEIILQGYTTQAKETVLNTQTAEHKMLFTIAACFNNDSKKYEMIFLDTRTINNWGIEEHEKAMCCLSENVAVVFYPHSETVEDETEDETDNEIIESTKSKLFVFSKNFPQETLEDYIISKLPKTEYLIKNLNDTLILKEVEDGQEIIILSEDEKKPGLEFLQGSAYVFTYPKEVFIPKIKLNPYVGKISLCLKSIDVNSVEEWKMYTPKVAYNEKIIVYTEKTGTNKILEHGKVPNIRTYATHGSNSYIVYEDSPSTLYYQESSKIFAGEYVGLSEEIKALEGTSQGIFIALENSIIFIQMVTTTKIEFYVNELKSDREIKSIGKEIIFFYGEGVFSYIKENTLAHQNWQINSTPIKAIQMGDYIVIKTDDEKLWILSTNSGEIALLSKSEDEKLDIDNFISNEDAQIFALIKGNPSYDIEWKQNKLMRIRAVESFNEIVKATVNEKNHSITRLHDAYKANLSGIIKNGTRIKLIFNGQIGKSLNLYTF